jgi:SAM-dependent methyltransferase
LISNSCGHCLKVSSIDSKDDFHNAQLTYFGDDSILLQPEPSVFDKEILAQRQLITRRFLPPKGSVLEVGPGSGFFAKWLQERGHDVTLVEYSPSLAEALSQRLGIKVVIGSLESCKVPEAEAVAFFSFHVVEHVTDPVKHLAAGLRAVRPGSYGFIATPNAKSYQQRLSRRLSPNFDSAHLRVFSPESLQECCLAAGWQIIDVETPEFTLDWMRVASKLMRKLRRENESSTAGKYAVVGFSRYSWIVRFFALLTLPLRFLQCRVKGGNEVFIVVRPPLF